MAQRFVTGIDTDGETLNEGDSLTVISGGAITVATLGSIGISSSGPASASIFGDVDAAGHGIRFAGGGSVFVGQSGSVTGGALGVSLGSVNTELVNLRNEGAITGQGGGVRLEGRYIDFVNTGTISVPSLTFGLEIAAVTMISGAVSYLTNTGTIIGGRVDRFQNAVLGGSGDEFVSNMGVIRGSIILGAGNETYQGQEGFWEGSVISLGTGQNVAYGGRGRETFDLVQEGDRLNDFVDGGGGIDGLTIRDGTSGVRVDLRLTTWQDTGVGGLTLKNVENLDTGDGHDRVIGNAEDNRINTGQGNDTLEGDLGDDYLNGFIGDDTAFFSDSANTTVDLRLTRPQNTGYGFDTLLEVENLTGGAGDDRFTGNNAANRLSGSGGNDTLEGGGGNDTLDGGVGSNTAVFSGAMSAYDITRSGGNATVTGADGTDTLRNIRFLKFTDQVHALTNAAPGSPTLSSSTVAENAPISSVAATLSATDADGDTVFYTLVPGSSSAFTIVGNSLVVTGGIDFEASRQHSVTIQAKDAYGGVATTTVNLSVVNAVETTPFTLRGTSAAESLAGEAGGDTLYGSLGNDVLTGGAGKDVFAFDTRLNKRTNVDQILDFNSSDDSIFLDNMFFTKLGSGTASNPKKFKADMFVQNTKTQDAEDRIVYDKRSGKLYYDQDGTGAKAQIHIATLINKAVLKYSDLFVI